MDCTVKSPALQQLLQACPVPGLAACLSSVERDFGEHAGDFSALVEKYEVFVKPSLQAAEKLQALVRAAVELASAEAPHWDKIAARLRYLVFARQLSEDEARRGITNFVAKLRYLTAKGLYGSYILEHYTERELSAAARFMAEERNHLYTYAGLDLLLSRYVIHTHHGVALESPQEMYLGIALHLAMLESPAVRMEWVRRFYDMLSLQQVTMATPTLANARKPYHQLSSCFIDTVPDSLEGIYRSLDSFAKVSKWGGGMGLYFGKVRATGAAIRGFEGAAGGVIRWIRLVNDTAVAVDQLGVRQGACAVYLDAWHKDLPEFLQLRTNNGDDRMKAHDIFPAVCYPDLFWKLAKEDLDAPWFLMDPHEIEMVMGYALEDFWGEEWEKRYRACVAEPRIDKRVISIKEIVRLILKSVVETGTPFAFYRDTVNRLNPNPQAGMIYCSNLCTEIAQNMSPVEAVSTEIRTKGGDTVVQVTTRPGDFVVCNLASLNLGRIDVTSHEELRSVVRTAVRALDNVIDLNEAPLAYAKLTNAKYRSIGLGVAGYHHLLAKHAIRWESEERLAFVGGQGQAAGGVLQEARLHVGSMAKARGKGPRAGHAQRLPARRGADELDVHPRRHDGRRRSHHEALLPRGEEGRHLAAHRAGPQYEDVLVLQERTHGRPGLVGARGRRAPAPHRPGAERQPLHHERLHLPPGARTLHPGLRGGRQDHLLRAQQGARGGGVRELLFVSIRHPITASR